jgi:hypothetical protein
VIDDEQSLDRASAQASLQAGAFGKALELLATAEDQGSGRSTNSRAPGPTCCGATSLSLQVWSATLPSYCSRPRGGSSRST